MTGRGSAGERRPHRAADRWTGPRTAARPSNTWDCGGSSKRSPSRWRSGSHCCLCRRCRGSASWRLTYMTSNTHVRFPGMSWENDVMMSWSIHLLSPRPETHALGEEEEVLKGDVQTLKKPWAGSMRRVSWRTPVKGKGDQMKLEFMKQQMWPVFNVSFAPLTAWWIQSSAFASKLGLRPDRDLTQISIPFLIHTWADRLALAH